TSVLSQDAESVSIIRFESLMQTQEREASARVESLDQATISAEVAARVVDLPVRVGERVSAGQILVQLDAADYELALQAAQARLEVAQAGEDMARLRAERARRLAPDQFVSDDQLLEAETLLRQTQAEKAAASVELGRAELMLSRTQIVSPYEAIVQSRLTGTGALAAPGTPLVELVATERLEISSGVANPHVEGLMQSDEVVFEDGERRYPVRLLRVSALISPGARQREARFEFIDESPAPGSQGTIAWVDPRPVLPADYVMTREGELGVLLVDSNQVVGTTTVVRWQPLPQADAGRPVQVDLPMDLLLINEGRRRVQPGETVQIVAESL
ncbi:MAG: efflux RND transporter periplasmic adaptor subunit, partial [Pseudomonadota bacterium]